MIEKLLIKLNMRDEVTADEEAALRDAAGDVKEVPADRTIIRAGERLENSTLLLEGLMCRYKDLRDGSRQISELHVPGDFADLHSFTLKRLDHNIMCLTPCRLLLFPHEKLKRITEEFPHLTRLLWLSTNVDAAVHREWVLSIGRRSALARIAHFFCELHVRLGIVGLTDGATFKLGITQADLAECLGLTGIHVNRMLKVLRERNLVAFKNGVAHIMDRQELARVAEFSTDYLSLERIPR